MEFCGYPALMYMYNTLWQKLLIHATQFFCDSILKIISLSYALKTSLKSELRSYLLKSIDEMK